MSGAILEFTPRPLRAAQGRKAHALATPGRVNVFLMPDARVEIRASYKAAPHGALTLYAALARHHIPAVRRLFAKDAQRPGGLRAIEAAAIIHRTGQFPPEDAKRLRSVLSWRIRDIVEGRA